MKPLKEKISITIDGDLLAKLKKEAETVLQMTAMSDVFETICISVFQRNKTNRQTVYVCVCVF